MLTRSSVLAVCPVGKQLQKRKSQGTQETQMPSGQGGQEKETICLSPEAESSRVPATALQGDMEEERAWKFLLAMKQLPPPLLRARLGKRSQEELTSLKPLPAGAEIGRADRSKLQLLRASGRPRCVPQEGWKEAASSAWCQGSCGLCQRCFFTRCLVKKHLRDNYNLDD